MAGIDEDQEVSKPKKKGKLLKIIIIVAVIVALAGGGVFAYLMFFSGDDGAATTQAVQEELPADAPLEAAPTRRVSAEAGEMYDFPTFIVNLADPAGSRYLRVSLSAEIPLKGEKLKMEVEQKLPKIKDAIITVLSSKTLEEITTPQGKISLKQELLRRVNSNLASGRLLDIYITEFVVQ